MINKLYRSCFILCCFSLLLACNVDESQQLPDRQFSLSWSDEFDGPADAKPDSNKWVFDIGRGQDGWGNQELQYYTDRSENVRLDGEGHLEIIARSENFRGAPFTSGRIKTQNLFSQQYGRFEARMKLPYGPGLWPAFWMLGDNIETVGWPQCGEIDIMEFRGQEPHVIHGSLHGPGYSAGNSVTGSYGLDGDRFDDEFRVYAVEWTEEGIDFFVDDIWYQRLTPEDVEGEWVFDAPQFLLLNVAVGGTFVGFPTPQTPFPQKMIVDYVRVYE